MEQSIHELSNQVMEDYKAELHQMLNGDDDLLARLDGLFLLPIALDEEVEPISSDFISGFCAGLLAVGKLKSREDSQRLQQIITSARALLMLSLS